MTIWRDFRIQSSDRTSILRYAHFVSLRTFHQPFYISLNIHMSYTAQPLIRSSGVPGGGFQTPPEIPKISVESSIAWAGRTGVLISVCISLCSHTVVIYYKRFLLIHTVLQWHIWFRISNPTRHPESLSKSNRIANWAENV